jgi:AcrR family transcriptional regulator
MPTPASASATSRRRARHDPRETEREILDAAEQLLRELPFREVTVETVMRRTGLKRPAFYVHFRDRHDLVLHVVQRIGDELFEMANRWLNGDHPTSDVRYALEGVAAVYIEHGPVLRALADAAGADAHVETTYRGLVQAFIDATARHIRQQQAQDRIPANLDADETARALIWLNERYLSEAFGSPPHSDVAIVVATLDHIWTATLYGSDASAR